MKFTIKTVTDKDLKRYTDQLKPEFIKANLQAGDLNILSSGQYIFKANFDPKETNQANIIDLKKYAQESNNSCLIVSGTEFQIKVWLEALQIPAGTTATYQDLADKIGHPKAHRAVANALGKNKIAYFIPCHRVIRKNGSLGGYRWGIDIKKKLLELEKTSELAILKSVV